MRIISFDKKNSRQIAFPNTAGRNACLVPYNNKIYKFGGTSSIGTTAACSSVAEVYDIQTNTWSLIASLPIGIRSASGFEHGGFIYIYGGFTGSSTITVSGALYRYDPINNTYTTMSSGSARAGAISGKLFVDGKWYFYALYGWTTTSSITTSAQSFQRYDISLNSWSNISVSNANLVGGTAAVVYNNKIYSFWNAFNSSTESYVFDPSNNSMTTISPTGTSNSNNPSYMVADGSAAVVGNNIYLFNGQNVFRYTPELDSWNRDNFSLQDKFGSSVVAIGNDIYCVNGVFPSSRTIISERYTPDVPAPQTATVTQITDFSAGTTFSQNGLTVVNSSKNRWIIGTGGGSGTTGNSAYIAPVGSTVKGYNTTVSSVSHFYFDYTVPTTRTGSTGVDHVNRQVTAVQLSFFMNLAVGSDYNYDFFSVAITNTTTVPVPDVEFTSGRVLTTKRSSLTPTYFGYQFVNLTSRQGQTVRFVFSWLNDSLSGDSAGGITIDDIKIKVVK